MSSGSARCYSECGHLRVVDTPRSVRSEGTAGGMLCCAVAGGALGEHTGHEAVRGSAALTRSPG